MNDSQRAYVDFTTNQTRHAEGRDARHRSILAEVESKIDSIIERETKLPALIIHDGDYVELLKEARDLFRHAFFYSCVAMCGIVSERILKNILSQHIRIQINDKITHPNKNAMKRLERLTINQTIDFLSEKDCIDTDVKNSAHKLRQLRNRYAHAGGTDPEGDTLKAIQYLHKIVEGTVSLLKDHQILDGKLVSKNELEDGTNTQVDPSTNPS